MYGRLIQLMSKLNKLMDLNKDEQRALDLLNEKERMNMDSFSIPSYVEFYNKKRFLGREAEVAEDWLSQGGGPLKILDITCGTGRTSFALKQMGHSVTGVDIAPAMIEVARKEHPNIEFHIMNACELKFPDATFDVAYVSWNGFDQSGLPRR